MPIKSRYTRRSSTSLSAGPTAFSPRFRRSALRKRSIGLDSEPSGNAGRATGFNDHQTSSLGLLVCVAQSAVRIETQRQIIQDNARAGILRIIDFGLII